MSIIINSIFNSQCVLPQIPRRIKKTFPTVQVFFLIFNDCQNFFSRSFLLGLQHACYTRFYRRGYVIPPAPKSQKPCLMIYVSMWNSFLRSYIILSSFIVQEFLCHKISNIFYQFCSCFIGCDYKFYSEREHAWSLKLFFTKRLLKDPTSIESLNNRWVDTNHPLDTTLDFFLLPGVTCQKGQRLLF